MHELESIDRQLADALANSRERGGLRFADDDEVLGVLQTLGSIQRCLDGAIVEATDRVVERDQCERAARLTTQAGCRDAADLLRRTLLVDGHAARRYVSTSPAVHRDLDITSGSLLPADFPQLAAALSDGAVSLSGFLACTTPLQKASRIGTADRLAADAVLAQFATGRSFDASDASSESAPAPTTDELAGLAAHIIAHLDPDGAEPRDKAAKHRRYFTIGKIRDGSVPVRGNLLPEAAAQLEKLIDSLMNPKVDDNATTGGLVQFRPSADDVPERTQASDASETAAPGTSDASDASDASDRGDGLPDHVAKPPPAEVADVRTHAQKRHDAFATVLMVAAASGGMPQLGGAAPTLVVSVSAEDFVNRTGRAMIEGAGFDVPLAAAGHAACAAGVERVLFDDHGAIAGISTSGRIFNARQRRAIVLRDKKCLVPGCDIRAEWCEIHHVTEYARGGPTHTSNGVPLCWHHHRTLDDGFWFIRMRNGHPEIRGPGWWDPYAKWRSPRLDYAAVDEAIDTERVHAWNSW